MTADYEAPGRKRLIRAPVAPKALPAVCIPVTIHRYRVLYSDGAMVDYLASSDNSNIRAAMVAHKFGAKPDKFDRIEGVVDMGVEYVHTPELKDA